MRTLLAATGIAVAATVVGVGAYAAQSPATTPTSSTAVTVDDNGGLTDRDDRVEPGDDRDVQGGSHGTSPSSSPGPSSSPSTSPVASAVDDNGGLVDRDLRVETGDDRGSGSRAEADEDGYDDAWDDHGGDDSWGDHGGDDD